MEPNSWWDFHSVGDAQCDACAVEPVPCDCGRGLVHTQFTPDLDATEGRCDYCQKDVSLLGEV